MKKNILLLMIGIAVGGLLFFIYSEQMEHKKETHDDQEEVGHGDKDDDDHGDKDDDDHDDQEEKGENAEKSISISDEIMKEFDIEVKTVSSGKILMHLDLTGEVVPDPYKIAHIVPRFGGVVLEVYKRIGDKVKKGDKLALIENNDSLAKYPVISSVDGTILEMHMTPGEVIGDKHGIMVADLKTVWAELNVYQKDLNKIKLNQTVEFLKIDGSKTYSGKIFYISPTVDEGTRTATVRVKIDNSKGSWKPGMFISAKVFTSDRWVKVAIDKAAIQQLDDKTVVFVKKDDGFRPTPVIIGLMNTKNIEIISGLHEGEKYISKGSFTFKSEILKKSFGGGHAH